MDTESEKTLVVLCWGGDRGAYAELVKVHAGRVFAICFGMLGNRHDAEDMAQQAFLKGFMQIQGIRDSGRFGPWIARIARNLCIDAIRQRKHQRVPTPEAEAAAPAETWEYGGLEAALAKLHSDYRVPLLLFYFDGRSTRTIAETLGTTQAAVQARLSRGRKQLRRLLQAEGDE
ncbi:MAG: sigma-70 family RNA polymerase sigma factor [Planctomycetes bacterium]|nr:sigma-70 family RNA polymerase sigma factor [Planctomycetota bacterium]